MKHLFCVSAALSLCLTGCVTPDTPSPRVPSYAAFSTDVTPMASAPLADDKVLTRIAFGSCNRETNDQTIWTTIKAENPDLFLFLGDNVYGDPWTSDPLFADPTMPKMRESYNTLAKSEQFASLRQDVPVMTTWDDHDYGVNDGGAEYLYKDLSQALYLDAWNVAADDERRARDGIHTSRIVGPVGKRVQIILLDTRFFRTYLQVTDERGVPGKERYVPLEGPHGTMLGEAQWDWLKAELQKPADVRLIASSIQVIADGHGWEAWGRMPHERERFFDLIEQTNAKGVVLLSGDRHARSIYRRDDVVDYPLYEVTASSLNVPIRSLLDPANTEPEEAGPHRLHPMQYNPNYGLIDIDWDARNVTLTVASPEGGDFVNTVEF